MTKFILYGGAFLAVSLTQFMATTIPAAALGCWSLDQFAGDCLAIEPGEFATALGKSATANTRGTAVGNSTKATGNATAFGTSSQANAPTSTAVGINSLVTGVAGLAVGSEAWAGGAYATALGSAPYARHRLHETQATGSYSIAIGGGDGTNFEPGLGPDIVIQLNGALASGFISTAVGTASQAKGGGSTAIGLYARGIGHDSVAIGEFSTANNDRSVALGLWSSATGQDSFAEGYLSQASGRSSLALGASATASAIGSVALGSDSVADVFNVVSVGSPSLKRRVVNVANGTNSTDAVNLGQLQAATAVSKSAIGDELGALRRELAQLKGLLRAQQDRIAELEMRSLSTARNEP